MEIATDKKNHMTISDIQWKQAKAFVLMRNTVF